MFRFEEAKQIPLYINPSEDESLEAKHVGEYVLSYYYTYKY